MGTIRTVLAGAFAALLVLSCAAHEKQEANSMNMYYQALQETEQGTMDLMGPGMENHDKTIQGFKDYYSVFSAEKIKAQTRDLYAENAYFRDGFRQVKNNANIEKYFLGTTEAIQECTFDIKDVAYHDGNYYFRWIMSLKLKRNPDNPLTQAGMSHVRFNTKGRIVFHRDYWETAALYERLPVLGSIIRWIKKQI